MKIKLMQADSSDLISMSQRRHHAVMSLGGVMNYLKAEVIDYFADEVLFPFVPVKIYLKGQ